MQQKLFIIFLLILSIGTTKTLHAQIMQVKERNGTQTSYHLSTIRKMSFSSGNLTVTKSDNNSVVYALNAMSYLNYSNIPIGIYEPFSEQAQLIFAYPNPARDMLYIDLSGADGTKGSIIILTIEGKTVLHQQVRNESIKSLDISHLPKGIYFCLYQNSVETKPVKIIKQ